MAQEERRKEICPRCEEIAKSINGIGQEKRCEECGAFLIIGRGVPSYRIDNLKDATGPPIRDMINRR